MSGCVLSGNETVRCICEANFLHAQLNGATVSHLIFENCDFFRTIFTGAKIEGCQFVNCVMCYASLDRMSSGREAGAVVVVGALMPR